jgi:hypothetical protein
MNSSPIKRSHERRTEPAICATSKFLSFVLRHEPEAIGLSLDHASWADVDALIACSANNGRRIDRALIAEVVSNNDKQRFELSADHHRIRARQGHSIPVDLGLEPGAARAALSWHRDALRGRDPGRGARAAITAARASFTRPRDGAAGGPPPRKAGGLYGGRRRAFSQRSSVLSGDQRCLAYDVCTSRSAGSDAVCLTGFSGLIMRGRRMMKVVPMPCSLSMSI